MSEQIDIFGNAVKITPKIDKEKRNWENRFQRWSDKQMHVSSISAEDDTILVLAKKARERW